MTIEQMEKETTKISPKDSQKPLNQCSELRLHSTNEQSHYILNESMTSNNDAHCPISDSNHSMITSSNRIYGQKQNGQNQSQCKTEEQVTEISEEKFISIHKSLDQIIAEQKEFSRPQPSKLQPVVDYWYQSSMSRLSVDIQHSTYAKMYPKVSKTDSLISNNNISSGNSLVEQSNFIGLDIDQKVLLQKLQSMAHMTPQSMKSVLQKSQLYYIENRIQTFRQLQPQNMAFLDSLFPSIFPLFRMYRNIENDTNKQQIKGKNRWIREISENPQFHYRLSLNWIRFEMKSFCRLKWQNLLILSLNYCNLRDEDWKEFVANIHNFNQIQSLDLNYNKIKEIKTQDFIRFPSSLKIISLLQNPLNFVSLDQLDKVRLNRKLKIELNEQATNKSQQQEFSQVLSKDITNYSFIEMSGSDFEERLLVNEMKFKEEEMQTERNWIEMRKINEKILSEVDNVLQNIRIELFKKYIQSETQLDENLFIEKMPSQQVQETAFKNQNKPQKKGTLFDIIKQIVTRFGQFISFNLDRFWSELGHYLQQKQGNVKINDIEGFAKDYFQKYFSRQSLQENLNHYLNGNHLSKKQSSEMVSKKINTSMNQTLAQSVDFYPVNEDQSLTKKDPSVNNNSQQKFQISQYIDEMMMLLIKNIIQQGYSCF